MSIRKWASNLGLENEEFREIFEVYMETTSSDLEGLKRAIANGDAEEVHLRAHSIKGASGNLGIDHLYELAKEIEHNAKNNIFKDIMNQITDFETKYKTIVETFKNAS